MDKQERMKAAFSCFCAYMDGEGLQYDAETSDEKHKCISLRFVGNGFPMDAVFVFEEEAERIFVYGKLPFTPRKEKVGELLLAVSFINQIVAVGTFCVDPKGGVCNFESNEALAGVSGFEPAYAERVIVSVFSAIEKFGAQLAAVNDGTLGADDVVKADEETGAEENAEGEDEA